MIQAEEVLFPQLGGSPVRNGNGGGVGFGSGFWAIGPCLSSPLVVCEGGR